MTKRESEQLLNEIFLQPWFLPQEAAKQGRRIIPPAHRHKMRFYFEDYGCLKCGKKSVRHESNGFCKSCFATVKMRFFFAIKRRWTALDPNNNPRTFMRISDAQARLKDIVKAIGPLKKKRRLPTLPSKMLGIRRSSQHFQKGHFA